MCSGQILFAGDSDIGQLFKIFDLLGTPGPGKTVPWEGVEALPHFNEMFPNMRPKDLRAHATTAELCENSDGEDMLRRMLAFDPLERISAIEALKHPFLCDDAPPLGSPSPEKSLSRAALLSPPSAGSHRSLRSVTSNDADGGGCDALSVWDAWRMIETVQRVQHTSQYTGGDSLPQRVLQLRDQTSRALGADTPSPSSVTPRSLRSSGQAADVQLREQAVLWMLRVSNEFCRCDRTLHLAVAVLDYVERRLRKPSTRERPISGLLDGWSNRLAIASLLLACKFQEVAPF